MESIDIEYLLHFSTCVKCGWNEKALNSHVSVLKFQNLSSFLLKLNIPTTFSQETKPSIFEYCNRKCLWWAQIIYKIAMI